MLADTAAQLLFSLARRQDDGSTDASGGGGDAAAPEVPTVTIECDTGNDFDGRIGLRISAIFVILVGSLLGAMLPVILARHSKLRVGFAFFVAKYFGSGVIIATAFMHLLSPAHEALSNPCLPDGPITAYDWATGICLMTVMVMFTVELLVSRFDFFGGDHNHDVVEHDPSLDVLAKKSAAKPDTPVSGGEDHQLNDIEATAASTAAPRTSGFQGDVSYPPGGEDHLGHRREHKDDMSHTEFAAQMTGIFILEFGVLFHSIFIGLTLAVSGDEFIVLYIVLVFHQTFEGLGLGSRLATAQWPRSKAYMPYLLAGLYALSTPVAIAAGLGVRETLEPGSPQTLIINGVFDAISAGILIYTGLVELLAHEFMFNEHMRKAGLKQQLLALGCVFLGAGLMAVLAIWA
ncbi:Zinc/iron permease [Microdochium trichocladiopsis]|uniref:Zinc/iron permease n=1 Tax=Microdochium trichocladiopsis TaxID=1682393 RepID=A0A9P9BUV1_9PEZI|nr:Zinc/iron permease [Microdochium trichocladiopsis]KAH7041366.1 Zinc/iron permease [Microdochium trichocladiopsis]